MKPIPNHLAMRTTRLGSADPDARLRQSMANVRLEGLTPNPKTAKVIRAMAEGAITPEAAITEIRSWYVRRA